MIYDYWPAMAETVGLQVENITGPSKPGETSLHANYTISLEAVLQAVRR